MPSPLSTTVPLAASPTSVTEMVSPSGSESFASTSMVTGSPNSVSTLSFSASGALFASVTSTRT